MNFEKPSYFLCLVTLVPKMLAKWLQISSYTKCCQKSGCRNWRITWTV